MYRIIRDDGMELGITDSILFIKIAENGCCLLYTSPSPTRP